MNSCYHCGEELPEPCPWEITLNGESCKVCCIGCQAIMQAILDAGLSDYYRFRTRPAESGLVPDDMAALLEEVMVFDEPEFDECYLMKSPSADQHDNLVDLTLAVEGLRCGACVWVLERAISAMPGVVSTSVNYSTARAVVRFDTGRLKISDVLQRVSRLGYKAMPFDSRKRERLLQQESRVFLQRLFLAGIATMQVMMYALPAYISGVEQIDMRYETLLRWASLVLTTPVLIYSAQPFFSGAWRGLTRGVPGMDVPVSVSILAAYTASVWSTISGKGEIYFDTVSMFVFLLLGARYIEWSIRRRAMRAVDDISLAAPQTAQRVRSDGHAIDIIPAARLAVGDIIAVAEGDRIPVDGRVHSGRSAINNALITGEARPIPVSAGQEVPGGALLTGSPIQLRVIRTQAASALSTIDRLIDRGAAEKPLTMTMADRIATGFVTAICLFAAMVWLAWMYVDPSRAGAVSIAVLVVSCPCALSLATPAALSAATGALLKKRILITRGHTLETLARVSCVVFDKTGTLTVGKPVLCDIETGVGLKDRDVLAIAALMESGSSHTLAQAIRDAATTHASPGEQPSHAGSEPCVDGSAGLRALGFPVEVMEHRTGFGISATWRGEFGRSDGLYLGSAQWCGISADEQAVWTSQLSESHQSASEIYLTRRTETSGAATHDILARFLLRDTLRLEATELIERLRSSGLTLHLLSGDREESVRAVADQLQFHRYQAASTPEQKQAYVAALQRSGEVVLMVGDGINDAPVLASADVSMAAGDATALARTAADAISLLPGLEGLEYLMGKAVETRRIVTQNLAWAILYNTIAIPSAALGLVSPAVAAVGMAGSSLLVVANAQRLWTTANSRWCCRVPISRYRWNHCSS